MATAALLDSVVQHLGGEERLKSLGALASLNDETHVSVRLLHPNARGVRSVIIARKPNGFFDMKCFGPLSPGAFSAPRIDQAENILLENLASVMGKLTGDPRLQQRQSQLESAAPGFA